MAIDILYFAWVREAIGKDGERVSLPTDVRTAAALIGWLAKRGEGYARAFADPSRIRVAVDQHFAGPDASIVTAREVSLFPPVTGG